MHMLIPPALDNCAYRPFPEHSCDCEGHEAVGGKSQVQGEAAHVVLQINELYWKR